MVTRFMFFPSPPPTPPPIANKQFHWVLHVSLIKTYFHIIDICTRVIVYSLHPQSYPHQPVWSSSCFSSVFLFPQFFLWMWIAFFLISPSELSWIIVIAASREIHYIWLCHSVSVSVYNILLLLLLSFYINSWSLFQFTWNSSSSSFLWAQ